MATTTTPPAPTTGFDFKKFITDNWMYIAIVAVIWMMFGNKKGRGYVKRGYFAARRYGSSAYGTIKRRMRK